MEDGTKRQRYPVSFTGSGGQFFKIWIVNIVLTVLTLYIYSAWAKIRTKRYFYGNTVLDGSSFEYHAKPLQILLSRLVAAALFIVITFGQSFIPYVTIVATVVVFLIIPWAIWRSTKFNLRMTSYRNVRFGFDGSVWPLYLYQFLLPLLVYGIAALGFYAGKAVNTQNPYVLGSFALFVLVLYIVVGAFTHARLSSYFLNHYLYGKSRFSGKLSAAHFFKIYFFASLLGLGTLGVLAVVFYASQMPDGIGISELIESISNKEMDKDALGSLLLKLVFWFYAYIFIVGFYLAAFIRAYVRNYVFANAVLDKRVAFESTVTSTGLWWVMTSNLLLIIISLGLAQPFTQVRMARYMAKNTNLASIDHLDDFVGEKRQEVGAFGDELGDAFDMDMDVGF